MSAQEVEARKVDVQEGGERAAPLAANAELFKALGDSKRLEILALLQRPPAGTCAAGGGANGRVCACDLVTLTGLSQPTVSHHMRVLVRAGLVQATKRGRWTDYALQADGFMRAQRALGSLQPCLPERHSAGTSTR